MKNIANRLEDLRLAIQKVEVDKLISEQERKTNQNLTITYPSYHIYKYGYHQPCSICNNVIVVANAVRENFQIFPSGRRTIILAVL